ncbi:RsfA family transcriptional regulator [Novibacillus thermophilus]|jgi:prespore-specific regulator|uniref:RsfA family transcriptional regulator n=1 Tax=Novibacillus thermophilus TaxID=1471761 RepID=A0A1U9K640_9BACL|nr:RsfA family transcriptional regulator [Novibacillus thermophilus]AQS55504.1 RsfA family transcriptional regulator [Novibacillus thermophilus]
MPSTRQDAWTEDDDLLLAEVTLRHIREGSTQLAAFEEVAEKLGRTPAACGFRWNSCVRKNYDAAIQIAKSQRQGLNKRRRKKQVSVSQSELERQSDPVSSLATVIRFLRQHKQEYAETSKRVRQLEKQLSEREAELEQLRTEHEELKRKVNNTEADYQSINDDYKALIKIMERARKLALLDEEDSSEEKPKFKMDVNGNLERVDK